MMSVNKKAKFQMSNLEFLEAHELNIWMRFMYAVKKKNDKPQNFNVYLNALLALTNHISLTVNAWANELWAKFCRHPEIVKD